MSNYIYDKIKEVETAEKRNDGTRVEIQCQAGTCNECPFWELGTCASKIVDIIASPYLR